MIDSDLPDELQVNADDQELVSRDEMLATLGRAVAAKRDEAVQARKDSGVEEVWMQCEESYLCIDDMNRGEFANAKWAKPTSMQGPVTTTKATPGDGRSTVFVRLTPRYVDMAAAKLSEIVLAVDDKAFSFGPTPVPELIQDQDNQTPLNHPQTGEPIMMPAAPAVPAGAPVAPGAPGNGQTPVAQAVQATVSDVADAQVAKAEKASDKAEKRIYDWMVESDYQGEMHQVIFDAARLGVGVLKGPFPVVRKGRSVSRTAAGIEVKTTRKVKPGYKHIDPWNFFPHGACGEKIGDGDYTVERDTISGVTLKRLKNERDSKDQPIYLETQVDKVLEEGPDGHKEEPNPTRKRNKGMFDIWYFTGTLSRKDMALVNAVGVDELPEDVTDVSAVVTLVNNSVIRATISPLEDGEYGYHALPWSKRAGSWTGVGVAEQVSTAQKVVNASSRAVFNNAGVSAGVQIIMDPIKVVPANQSPVITPNKLWYLTADGGVDDVRKVFAAIEIPNVTAQLMPIIEYGMKMAEEASNIPLISQGHDGEQTPQTFGQAQLQNTNANSLLRNLARSVDGCITEPVVKLSYDWLLVDPDVPDEEKGDFQINAKGSISMVEKAIQEQFLMQLANLVKDPAFGMDPELWAEELLRAKRMDPRKIMLSDEKKAQRAQQPPPEAPQITAAKINAQSAQQLAQERNQTTLQAANIAASVSVQKSKLDTDRDTAYVQAEAARTQQQHEAKKAEIQMKWELAQLDYANQHGMKLEDVKAKLADTAMKLNVQKELSMAALGVDVHKHHTPAPIDNQVIAPPTEPVGRAPAGEAFAA